MHPCIHARTNPDKPAVIVAETGEIHTYKQLDEASNRAAQFFRSRGLKAEDVVAFMVENTPAFYDLTWGAQRSGLRYVCLSTRLTADEADYILENSGAKLFVMSASLAPLAAQLSTDVERYALGGAIAGYGGWEDAIAAMPATPIADERAGVDMLYSSGTTGRPKGTVHTHCGLTVKTGEDFLLCFDLKADDRLLWMTDFGWLVGPLQITATLLAGATAVFVEGTPDYPDPDRLWRVAASHRISFLGIGPTLARMMIRHGAECVARHDLSALRVAASTGEPWDTDSWLWVFEHVLRRKGPLMNYSGGTEVGGLVATNVLYPIKPSSFSGPIPGTGADIVDTDGRSVGPGEVGELVMRQASIGTTRGLWKDPDRYIESYWSRLPGIWVHGDWASRDADGSWFIHGRSDDTIKIAGKRTGPAEIEGLLIATHRVADAAAVAVPDSVKGSAVVCVVVPNSGEEPGDEFAAALSQAVVNGLGSAFRPKAVVFTQDLPRTRNMKTMRRVIRAVLLDEPPGDLSTLVNPDAVDELRAAVSRRTD